jgi:hypothetical protein
VGILLRFRRPALYRRGMSGTEPAAAQADTLTGPASLALRVTSAWGPFATTRSRLTLRPTRFTVTNIGSAKLSLSPRQIDRLRSSADGACVEGGLSGSVIAPAGGVLGPGDEALIEISGTVSARPGVYASAIRVGADGAWTLAIPLTVAVSASPLWGIACMLLGLGIVGTTSALTGESTVASQLRDALAARQHIHEWLERHPTPERLNSDVEDMDGDFDAAVAVLSQPRTLSVVDHRQEEANAQLRPAMAVAAMLHASLKNDSPAAAEVAELTRNWQALQSQMTVTANRPRPDAATMPGIGGRLDTFLYSWKQQFVGVPMQWVTLELTPQIDRVHLLLAAGQDDAARVQAIAVRRWLRRAAAMLDERLHTWIAYAGAAGAIAAADLTIRQRLSAIDLPEGERAAIRDQLDGAAAKLGDEATPASFAAAHTTINSAETALVRARAEQVKQRVQAAVDQAMAETSSDRVQAVTDVVMAVKPTSLQDKIAGLTRILAVWHELISGVSDAATHDALTARADALGQALSAGDLKASSPLYRALVDAWSDWQTKRVSELTAPILRAECTEQRDALLRNLVATEENIRLQPAGPQQIAWEADMDRVRFETLQAKTDGEAAKTCLDVLGGLERRRIAISNDVFVAMLANAAIPDAARVASAELSGVAEAIALTRQLATGPRPLTLQIRTPSEERTVGRRIVFVVEGLDPLWGSGVQIGVDFQDGSGKLVVSAEAVRQGTRIEHEYAAPRTLHPHLVAAEQLDATLTPKGRLLGEGDTTLLLRPSPVTRAQALADTFLNARFALALLVASVVYYWRFHSGKKALGENSFDYVEAFAVGFAVSLAVSQLTDKMAALAPTKA